MTYKKVKSNILFTYFYYKRDKVQSIALVSGTLSIHVLKVTCKILKGL